MAHEPLEHSKLHGKAFLRDLLTSYIHIRPSKQETARQDLANIQSALRLYHSKHRRFPSTAEGMRELVNRQGLEQVPRDPWGSLMEH
ncbi:type II secretion system protein GspG [Archangium violaceum]|uniref:type II secretion system protein GspG n=1 Tax=Archangium violaceum TaxID=83451 RepID=UPI00193BA10C|nr:type II secretion system protein GspG [Archangium violaceum]QRK09131.1 type II secretion system protein GspG [Archangium violaceum]